MLSSLTITEAHEQLKAKAITAEELVRACLDRIAAVDGQLNAVVFNNGDRALEEAKKIDQRGVFHHPLTGVPYLAKDVFCEEGVPTTACSSILRDKNYLPPFHSTTTRRLKALGAISLGKSNTDEFTMGASTETSCYGVARNPWDATRVAGGSSGGSAAAVAASECLFALGTDTGGSIRQPAGFCGCTGIRPTYGRVSRYGVMSMASSLDTIGPLCKTVEDAAMVLQAIAGKDELDATTGDTLVPDYRVELEKSIAGLRLGLPKEYFVQGMNQEVESSVRAAAEILHTLGATVQEVSLPHTKYATPAYYILCPCEVSSNMARYDGIRFGHTVGTEGNLVGSPPWATPPFKERSVLGPTRPSTSRSSFIDSRQRLSLVEYYERVRSEGFGKEVKRRIMIGTYALSAGYYEAYYLKAQKVRTLIHQDFERAFEQVDLILSPVSPTPAFAVGAHQDDPVAMYLEDIFLCGQPMAGIPALSIPCGFSLDNLPIGLQIMGPQWQEARILQAAHAYQQATDWHTRTPLLKTKTTAS